MRCGIYNIIAVEGAKIPNTIKKLSKEKETTAFLDGDRGGDLILKELLQVTNIKYVSRAPRGKEVEELNCREIFEALKKKSIVEKPSKRKIEKPKRQVSEEIVKTTENLKNTLEAVLLNELSLMGL